MEVNLGSINGEQGFGSLFIASPLTLNIYPLAQGIPQGTSFGLLSMNIQGSFQYSLVEGDGSLDNSYFIVQEDELVSNNLIDKNQFSIRVRATGDDGYCYEQIFLLDAVDTSKLSGIFDEYLGDLLVSSSHIPTGVTGSESFGLFFISSPIRLTISDLDIEFGTPVGTEIGTLSSILGNSFLYQLVSGDGSEDNSYFSIIDEKLVVSSLLDKNSFSFRVRAVGNDGYCYEQKFVLGAIDTSMLSGFFDGGLGTFALLSTFVVNSIGSQQGFGLLEPQSLLRLPSLESEFDSGSLMLLMSHVVFSIETQEELPNHSFFHEVSLASIQTQESLTGSLLIDHFVFSQSISWDVDKKIALKSSASWNIGQGVPRWYRVQGCCLFPTSQGSGDGISGSFYPGGCEVSNFESIDSKCIGAGGKQLFIQNILATGIRDVCNQLNSTNMRWQVCSIQVYSNPAGPAQDECNTLIDVPFSSYPECIEISLEDTLVNIRVESSVSISFKYSGGGAVSVGGLAKLFGGEPLASFVFSGSGSVLASGFAEVDSSWDDFIEINSSFSFDVTYFEPILSQMGPSVVLNGATSLIKTVCGSCTSIPSIVYCSHNLKKSYLLSRFIRKNDIDFPNYFTMYYNSLLRSWVSNYQITGDGDSGEERWNFVFSWSCLNKLADEFSNPYWKYSIFINRANNLFDSDTRINITFPPDELCRIISNLSIDFSFSVNVETSYVENSFDQISSNVVFTDKIGFFKDNTWLLDPWLNLNISRSAASLNFRTIDLLPLLN